MKTKQVIVMRTDLNMRKGKMAAQAAHASMAFLTRQIAVAPSFPHDEDDYTEVAVILSPLEIEWLDNSFTKICVGIGSEAELLDLDERAGFAGVQSCLIQDNGTTEFGGVPTYTCLALGPDDAERIDMLTGALKLL